MHARARTTHTHTHTSFTPDFAAAELVGQRRQGVELVVEQPAGRHVHPHPHPAVGLPAAAAAVTRQKWSKEGGVVFV